MGFLFGVTSIKQQVRIFFKSTILPFFNPLITIILIKVPHFASLKRTVKQTNSFLFTYGRRQIEKNKVKQQM